MAVVPNASPFFELKSASLSLVAVVLKTTDLALLSQALDERFGDAPGLFDQDPVAIDLSLVREVIVPIDFVVLVHLLRGHNMLPVAVRGGNSQQMEDALAAGLSEANGSAGPALPLRTYALEDPPSAPVPLEPEPTPPARTSMIIDKPLRSGQRVYAKGSDLIVLAVVSHGAE
ncbi:MAG: septum site-determining protein MinC, partial [Rhizobacter sp.]